MEVHKTTAIGKANKFNIEDDEALAEVPLLVPNVFFFSYVNEIFETSETNKERLLPLRNRGPNHYPFYQL